VEAEAAVADQADAAVEAFEAAVVEAESDRVEDPVVMASDGARELDEWLEPGPGRPCQPGVEVRWRERRVVELVEEPELLLQEERTVEGLIRLLDFAELHATRHRPPASSLAGVAPAPTPPARPRARDSVDGRRNG
jgi:hypothetical protein